MTADVDGIYTVYLAGTAGQSLAMFVFKDGKIGGSDVTGLVFRGSYVVEGERLVGSIEYTMPAGTSTITGMEFQAASGPIRVPLDLPKQIDSGSTYRINTPLGPLNARFVMNTAI